MASEQVGETLRAIRRDLDEFSVRLDALETAPLLTFRMQEATAARRRAVAKMRADGLSVTRIARAVGAGKTTIHRDLRELGLDIPSQSLGVDGATWHRRAAQPGT